MWLISFLITLITVLLIKVYYFRQQKIKVIISIVVVIALPLMGVLLNKIHWTTSIDDKLPVTLIQGNIAQGQKWEPSFYRDQLNLYWHLTQQHQRVNSLVIWPENAIPYLKESVQELLDTTIGVYEKNNKATLITGLPIRQQDNKGERYYNGITVVGEGEGTYLKQKLVPFGEYVPLQDMLRGMIEFLIYQCQTLGVVLQINHC